MDLTSIVCKKFSDLINIEIGAPITLHDLILEEGLKTYRLPFAVSQEQTLYDIAGGSIPVLSKMRLIYLLTLFEAFMKEYIRERKSLDEKAVKAKMECAVEYWNTSKSTRPSTSYMNLNYSIYILLKVFEIDISSIISPVTKEIGDLRNCVVHNLGIIEPNNLKYLPNTIEFLKIKPEVSRMIDINNFLMTLYLEDFRKIIKSCNY